jgi:hypothetical protein
MYEALYSYVEHKTEERNEKKVLKHKETGRENMKN